MRWKGARQSDNFKDSRGSRGGKIALGGIGSLIVLVIAFMTGGDPSQLLQQIEGGGGTASGPVEISAEEQELTEFSRVVLASTEDVWSKLFQQSGSQYIPSTLHVYSGGVQTGGCGYGSATFGPFYCPGDQMVYLDLSFNQELQQRFGAKGEFALAYVIAHEIGHHVQQLLGVLQEVQSLRGRLSEAEFNKRMVQLELQADFYAGVWAHHANKWSEVQLEYEDIAHGMDAAAAVGDDKLQMEAQGYVVPEKFTHGTSAQRKFWFKKGYDTGDPAQGDTFNDPSLQ
jgi:predicted metalloprotease